jgi:flagellar biosynthesis chaperone FliJ
MKRFEWRLQRVLDIRAKQEQVKKGELIEVTERLTRARGELLAQKRILKDIIDSLGSRDPKQRLGEQEFFLKYSTTNREKIKELESTVSQLESEQARKIVEVLKIRRFRQGLEKLRAEAEKRYITEQEKLEQKDSDERATLGFARKKAAIA